jgi:DNA invertase Pin-like site-specific DNA recombinase
MTALHANGVRIILIERRDRLARDLMVQETIIADLRRNGFELISVAEPDLMATDPTRILMRQLMGAVAQYDKSQIVLKLRGARGGTSSPGTVSRSLCGASICSATRLLVCFVVSRRPDV